MAHHSGSDVAVAADVNTKLEISEAELIALEVSGELLPPEKLSNTIKQHLAAIREKYPQVANIQNSAQWAPGELITSAIDDARINAVNASKYGPFAETKKIFSTDTLTIYQLMFSRPYHPKRLAEVLEKEFSVAAEPNGIIGSSESIAYKEASSTEFTYTFKKGWGDCPSGCINKHFWEFSVVDLNGNLNVNLVKEYGSEMGEGEKVGDTSGTSTSGAMSLGSVW